MDKRAMDSRLFVASIRRRVTGVVNIGNSNRTDQKGFIWRNSPQQERLLRRINQRTLVLQLAVRPVHQRADSNVLFIAAAVPTIRVCGPVLPPVNAFPKETTGFVLPTRQTSMRSV